MKHKTTKLFLLFGFLTTLIAFNSCKSSQSGSSRGSVNQAGIESFDFEALSIRSKLRFNHAGDETKAIANIRIRKDSAIWVSVSKTSVEGVRVLVTPDTIMMIDRINKEFYSYNYEQLQERFNFAFDYKMLESALTGEPYLPNGPSAKQEKNREFRILQDDIGNLFVKQFIARSNKKLTKVEAIDQKKNELLVEYDNFEDVDGTPFPHHNKATIRYTKDDVADTTVLDFEYSKVEREDASLKLLFKVNDKYTRVE